MLVMGASKGEFWNAVKSYDSDLYIDERLDRLVTVGIYKLSQASMRATFEDVSVVLHRMFPEKFALTSWPEHPDLIRIDNTLRLDCKHSNFVTGNRVTGFRLTATGKNVAEDTLTTLNAGKPLSKGQKKRSSMQPLRKNMATRLMREVLLSQAYKKFYDKQAKKIRRFDVADLLHGTLNTDDKILKSNLQTLTDYATDLKSIKEYRDMASSVLQLLRFIQSNWEELMNAY